jgi:hypothetical protein
MPKNPLERYNPERTTKAALWKGLPSFDASFFAERAVFSGPRLDRSAQLTAQLRSPEPGFLR